MGFRKDGETGMIETKAYKCDGCGEIYSTADEAEACEVSHKPKMCDVTLYYDGHTWRWSLVLADEAPKYMQSSDGRNMDAMRTVATTCWFRTCELSKAEAVGKAMVRRASRFAARLNQELGKQQPEKVKKSMAWMKLRALGKTNKKRSMKNGKKDRAE